MKVKARSWHYRLVNYWFDRAGLALPKTLCGYFWAVWLCFFLLLWAIPLTDFINRIEQRQRSEKEPGLFRSWLRARKDKVCPLMEYPDSPV